MSLEQLVKDWDPLLSELVPSLNPTHRAALWGQTLQESNAKPAAEESLGQQKGGKGLWQHTGDRLRRTKPDAPMGLMDYAASVGKPWSDTETQVRYTASELVPGGIRAHAREQLEKTTSPEAAAATAMAYFEAPRDWEKEIQHPGTTTANLPRRIDGTYKALAVIQAAQPGAKPVTDNPTPAPVATADDELTNWIKESKIPAEAVLRSLLVANGFPGFVVDLIFNIANPLIDQLATQFKPEDIGNLILHHLIQPILANLTKKTA